MLSVIRQHSTYMATLCAIFGGLAACNGSVTTPAILPAEEALTTQVLVKSFSAALTEDTSQTITLEYAESNEGLADTCSVTRLSNVTITSACICSDGICTVGIQGIRDYSGPASFYFTVTVDNTESDAAKATLTIANADDPPVVTEVTSDTITEDTVTPLTLGYDDPDGDLATVCSVTALTNLTATSACSCDAEGVCTVDVQGTSHFNGSASLTYTVTANGVASEASTASLTVTAVDDLPVADDITPSSFDEDVHSIITLSYTDNDGELATTCTPSALTNITVTTPCACDSDGVCTIRVRGTANYNGAASFEYTVTTGTTSDPATATLVIDAVNDAPTIVDPSDIYLREGTQSELVWIAVDEGGGADEDVQAVTMTVTSDNQTLLPDANFNVTYLTDGADDVTFIVLDFGVEALSGSATVSLELTEAVSGMTSSIVTFDVTSDNTAVVLDERLFAGGPGTFNQPGIYGTQGTGDGTTWPGGREGACMWADSTSNIWLFGGYGYGEAGTAGALNDLWKWDGTKWNWMKGSKTKLALAVPGTQGVADTANTPAARAFHRCVKDSIGNVWVFGGTDLSKGFDDLWKFDGTNWTWVTGTTTSQTATTGTGGTAGVYGASYNPPTRADFGMWVDTSDGIWVFAGTTQVASSLSMRNDLWRFNGTEWAFMGGDVAGGDGQNAGVGIPDPTNIPRARSGFGITTQPDGNGKIWLYGGQKKGGGSNSELWSFDLNTEIWVLEKAATGYSAPTKGLVGGAPGDLFEPTMQIDASGVVWLFGGYSTGLPYDLTNKLWRLNSDLSWIWVTGSSIANHETINPAANTATTSFPAGANAIAGFIDGDKFWLFGGYFKDQDASDYEHGADFWRFDLP